MKPVYHKIVQCTYCGKNYDKGIIKLNDWHKTKMCVPEKPLNKVFEK